MLLNQVTLAAAYGAVMAIDGHTGLPLRGVLLTFDGRTVPVRYKSDGHCVLTAPLEAAGACRVEAPGYAAVSLPVTADANGRFFALAALSPLAGNARYSRVRLQRVQVLEEGRPVAETPVRVTLTDKVPTLILTQGAAQGAVTLWLNCQSEHRLMGQWLALPGKQAPVQVLGETEHAPGLYRLSAPLSAEIRQGAQAAPFWLTQTDGKGEFILPHKPHLMRGGPHSLEVACLGKVSALEAGFDGQTLSARL